jgi:hypothetical protein
MRLFLPSARATNVLLIVGFCSLGAALYLRYFGIENTPVGLACQAGLNTWLCLSRRTAVVFYEHSAFGIAALGLALVNFIRPSVAGFAVTLIAASLGIVLYNAVLASLAVALLILSLARSAPASE